MISAMNPLDVNDAAVMVSQPRGGQAGASSHADEFIKTSFSDQFPLDRHRLMPVLNAHERYPDLATGQLRNEEDGKGRRLPLFSGANSTCVATHHPPGGQHRNNRRKA